MREGHSTYTRAPGRTSYLTRLPYFIAEALRRLPYSSSMPISLDRSQWVASCFPGLAALVLGLLVGTAPFLAAAAAFGMLILLLAFAAPVLHFTLLLFVAAVVPYSLQNSVGGGSAGLILADVLFLTGLARAGLELLQHPLDRRRMLAILLTVAFAFAALLQFVHAVDLGNGRAEAGNELRAVTGVGALLIALPLLSNARERSRLFTGMVVVGVLLGLWGIAQWLLNIPLGGAGDVGVREGVAFTEGGRGQVQGGAYGFPIAAVLSFAALISDHVRSPLARAALLAVFLLNTVSLVLTFERSFWLATVVGILLVIARAGRSQRVRAVLWTPVALVLVAVLFATIAPGQSTVASQRLLSVGNFENDSSLRYRIIESRHVLEEIRERPILGSGLGATIFWGRPAEGVPPDTYSYTHNGYLRLVWQLGAGGAALLSMLFAVAFLRRRRGGERGSSEVARQGAQAALFVLLIIAVTAPIFSTSTTALTGLLLALSVMPCGGRGAT